MKNKLVGWDDGKLYFYDEEGTEYSVNDHKELFEEIAALCGEYFRQKEIGRDAD